MTCPRCSCSEIDVTDTRPTAEGNGIRRRRKCASCGYRFTTYEHTRDDLKGMANSITDLVISFKKSFGTDITPLRGKKRKSL